MSDQSSINIRSESYFIARTTGTCPSCRAQTRLLALALPPLHHTLSLDADIEEDELAEEAWERASCHAFLFFVDHLPDAVRDRLNQVSSGYRLAYSAATQGCYFANHCEHCGTLLEDHDLFCEPEGAFLPTSPASASAIELIRIDEAIEAAAAGYACEPQFIESMVEI